MAEEKNDIKKPTVRVRDVMEKVFISVTPDIPVRDVFRAFIKHRLLAVPVVDSEDHLIGLISSADLMYRSSKPHIPRSLPFIGSKIYTSRVSKYAKEFHKLLDQPCSKLMTKDVMITTPKADVEQVAAVMILEHLKVLPVVDNKRVVGMITRACVLKDLYREGCEEEANRKDEVPKE
ncbi:MAG: CBS domain-containing protein [Megasphaera sp.]|uniref:CBS domain-containing protein n=1 Tax=Megasphaera sp. TaxID=2023260 RepID=UPI003F0D48BB